PVRPAGSEFSEGRVAAICNEEVSGIVNCDAGRTIEARGGVGAVGTAANTGRTCQGGDCPIGPEWCDFTDRIVAAVCHIEMTGVSFRMVLFWVSATYRFPAASTDTP